jgi:ATP-dependent Clp protease ATP-binding subunit ClpC
VDGIPASRSGSDYRAAFLPMTDFTLDLTGTRAYAALRLKRIIFGWPVMIAVALLAIGSLVLSFEAEDFRLFYIVVLSFIFILHMMYAFIHECLVTDTLALPANASPQSALSQELVHILLRKARANAVDLFEAAVSSSRGKFLLDEIGLSPADVMHSCVSDIADHIDVGEFVQHAATMNEKFNEARVDAPVILYLLFMETDCGKALLHKADLSQEDLMPLMHWEAFHHEFSRKVHALSPEAIAINASLGRSWVAGYTDALDSLTSEIFPHARHRGHDVVIHKEAIDSIMRVLSRGRHHNILLMGKVGVGKRMLVEHAAEAIRSLERSNNKSFTRVLILSTEKLLSGSSNPDAFLLNALSHAQRSGHFVLVIRDLALLLRAGNANLMAVLHKFLEAKAISIIGVADIRDYHALIKTNPVVDSMFEKIAVDDATEDETMNVLMAHYFASGSRGVRITYKALKSILELSQRYLGSFGGMPGKAVDVMDDAISRASASGSTFVTDEHVREVISQKSKVNVKRVSETERDRLLNLEQTLRKQIIGQDNAVRAVSGALKRARIDLHDRKRPIGTFLFLGPTGVGKTHTAKVLAQEYFGAADAIIRLDMNEYGHSDSVFGIIGSPGSGDGYLAQRVQDKPFSLILLDEIEKAHPSVLNLFLQILDEGFLTDSLGTRTDFRNTIIIATSNAGALFIRDFVREHASLDRDHFKSELMEKVMRDRLFAPEFLNRFDEIVLFYPLTREVAADVAMLMLDDIIQDVYKRRGIRIEMEEDVVGGLVERGYSVEFGAREMRRTITDIIEDYLADYLLRHDVRRGDVLTIKKGDLKW